MGKPKDHPLISHQPFNLLFRLLYVITVILRLPLWLVISLVAPPHPKWTTKQTLLCRIANAVLDIRSQIGITENLSLQPGSEGERFQLIQPFSSGVYEGPLLSRAIPEAVGATWFPQPPSKDIHSKIVVLYLHGGAFVQYNGRDKSCGFPVRTMAERGGVDVVLSLQYRLSGYSGRDPFPAALQDALTAYLFLLRTIGFPPRQIVLCGDSAGGNLAIALLRYIDEFGTSRGVLPPRCAALFSPWVSPFEYNVKDHPNSNSDFLPGSFLHWGALTYTDGVPDATSNPYIVPMGNPFTTKVPLFVNAGTAEIFFNDIRKWVKEMGNIKANQVFLYKEHGALHDTFSIGDILGFEESAREVVAKMGTFIRRF